MPLYQKIYSDKRNELASKVSKLANKANQRIDRLRDKGFDTNPALQSFMKNRAGQRFSVAGKNYRELQTELSQVEYFLRLKTGTITGYREHMIDSFNNIATNAELLSTLDLHKYSTRFWDVYRGIEDSLQRQGLIAIFDSEEIRDAVERYVLGNANNSPLNLLDDDIEDQINDIIDIIEEQLEDERQKQAKADEEEDDMDSFMTSKVKEAQQNYNDTYYQGD